LGHFHFSKGCIPCSNHRQAHQGVELPLALFGMAGMNLLNIFLGIDLFNAFRRENGRHHHESQKEG